MDQQQDPQQPQAPQPSQQESQPQSQAPQPDQKKVMGVLAYLGILIIIPFLMAKDDPIVKFHLKQGGVLFVIEFAVWVLGMTMLGWQLWQLLQLINLVMLVYSIIGIVNVIQGKQKELPYIGSYSRYIPL